MINEFDSSLNGYERYVISRKEEGLYFVESYQQWVELIEELKSLYDTPLYDESEYNPTNYPESKNKSKEEMLALDLQGFIEYLENSKKVQQRIKALENLLTCPADLILYTE